MVTRRGELWWQPRCCVCGRFVSYDADSGTMYGSSTSLEPPEDDYFCPRCAQKETDWYVSMGRILRCWWIKPACVRVASSILRHRRRHPQAAA